MAIKASSKSSDVCPPPGFKPKKTVSKPKGGYGGSGMAKKGKG